MTTIPDQVLIACLDALENGESAAEIMARYPEHADGLRPFLDTATMLQELPPAPRKLQQNYRKRFFCKKPEN